MRRFRKLTGATVTAVGLAAAAALAGCGSGGTASHPGATGTTPTPAPYSWYRAMMGRYYGGPMMGGQSYGWMMGQRGYRWMTGINGVPGWMRGGRLPGFMMGGGDPGTVMGRLWANAPGPRVSPTRAARLGRQRPAGATINVASRTITFHVRDVRLAILASPSMPAENFRAAGLVNPNIVVPAGARVAITLIEADPDMAHGLVITTDPAARSWMPMMTTRPAFAGAALWFLGDPTSAGMHAGTITFAATTPGIYRYLCPVPGHARKGMTGTLSVTSTP